MSSDAFDYLPNPELCTFTRSVTGSWNDSTDQLQNHVHRITSFEISTENNFCEHPKESPYGIQGFKIISTKQPNIVEVQFYGQYFCTTVDALRASWAGRSILFRHWYWIPLLRTMFEAGLSIITRHGYRIPLLPTALEPSDGVFRLKNTREGYFIGGSRCGRGVKTSDRELEECWEGGILVAEVDGSWSWKKFGGHVRRCFDRLMWIWVGRHISRMHMHLGISC